ncbi:Uncharacterized protein GBIM_20971 [Gryllus bimaculatus]|nr:Uncharacterized protein GBIM_20971 [Gryllus bimaculatus]
MCVSRARVPRCGLLNDACGCVQVLHCQEVGSARSRAVKVLRLEGQWSEAAMNEAQALATISVHNPDLHHLVRFYEAFQWGARLFLVMEALDRPLGAFIAQNGQALRMGDIACILKQLFCALRKLDERRICPGEALNHDFLTGENFT